MDLHVIGPLASPVERAAVDAVVGPATSGWHGGERASETEGHAARGGHDARSRRDLLLPALHALQDRVGQISQPGLNYVCRRLSVPPAEAYGVATFYALFSTKPRPPAVAHICDDIACRLAGAEDVIAGVERALGPAGSPGAEGRTTWLRSPCLGVCERAPAAMLTVAGERPRREVVAPIDAAAIVGRLEASSREPSGGSGHDGDAPPAEDWHAAARASVPQLGDGSLRLLTRVGIVDPTSLAAYEAAGGYRAMRNALAMGAEAAIKEVTDARLVGRGGAAFPTGRKWAAVAGQAAQPHYAVCNADESEPGTFKDRILMELDPFAVVESMTLEGYATGSSKGYLYIRGEYPLAESRLLAALDAARSAGYLGDAVGSRLGGADAPPFSFDVELRRGAGAYICGEETALFESIEGKRGEPRNKPPFPVEVGLFGKPTVVNNVETLVNVLLILGDRDGVGAGARFAASGTEGSTGPKLFCLSGSVTRPGLYEVPFGTTLRDLLALGGGVTAGRAIRAILLGGAAGVFVGPDALDVPLTFEGTRAIGATLGSGVVMVFDETADLVGTLRRIAAFFRDESCGQCVPCRVGTVRQEELLARLADGVGTRPREAELQLLADIGRAMRDASICGLGQTASSAIESAFRQPELVAM